MGWDGIDGWVGVMFMDLDGIWNGLRCIALHCGAFCFIYELCGIDSDVEDRSPTMYSI